jgi:hypothetical protein
MFLNNELFIFNILILSPSIISLLIYSGEISFGLFFLQIGNPSTLDNSKNSKLKKLEICSIFSLLASIQFSGICSTPNPSASILSATFSSNCDSMNLSFFENLIILSCEEFSKS